MRKILATATLATALLIGAAAPSFAEGEDYVAGPTAQGAWVSSTASRTPLAGSSQNTANFDMSRQGA